MKDFGTFLAQYWQMILASILTIISAVIALIRKKPVTSLSGDIYKVAIDVINEVEHDGILGAEQKRAVATARILNAIKAAYPNLETKKYISYIHLIIEDILSTPQKKGE